MQHFRHLDADTRERMFFLQPEDIAVSDGNNVVATALGATLYIPATRSDLTATVHKRTDEGVRSIVIDLEDAVADHDLQYAVENTIRTLNELSGSNALVFVRARTAQQIRTVCAGL
ncbi:MAG: ATP/GTP-binding protein, partial [Rhodococcus sp. (in: high G+C Gram-positive bacteria)]